MGVGAHHPIRHQPALSQAIGGTGVWKSSDGGATWATTTDGQVTLAIGAIAVDWSTTPETVYAGTGEPNRCQDCMPSQGVLKSTDGGSTWSVTGQSTFTAGPFYFSAMVVDSTNNQRILAATTRGLYQTTNGGTTWAQAPGTSNAHWDAVAQDPAFPNLFWGALTTSCNTAPSVGQIGVWDGSGAGQWTAKWPANGTNPPTNVIRIGLGVGKNNTVYAALAACNSGGYQVGQLEQVLKTTTAGASWGTLAAPDYFSLGQGAGYQGWYDNVIAVDPNDATANRVVFGGVTMLATTNGGSSFTDVAKPYNGGPLHPDFHAVAFTGASSFYAGNDGGVYSTTNLGGTGSASDWTNRNATLSVTQFYAGSSVDLTHLAGGSQDNGTAGNPQGTPPAPWNSILAGDGAWTAMFPGKSTVIGENDVLDMWQFDYYGTGTPTEVAPCSSPYTDPACNDPVGFIAPFVVDSTSVDAQHARVYAGTNRVYRTNTGGLPAGNTTLGTWVIASPDLTTGTGGGAHQPDFIHTMAIGSGSTSNTVITGSWFGKVFLTTSGPTASASSGWIDITGNLPPWSAGTSTGNAWITGVAVNPLDGTEAWVTIGTAGAQRVFHTHGATTASPTWTDISTTLPAGLIVDSILVDPIKPQNVYIGTDTAALICTTCVDPSLVASWAPLGTGLPNVRVDMLTLTADAADIVGWTHGRGAWYVPAPIGRPGAALMPSSLTFPDQIVGTTSASQDLTLTNNGGAPLVTASITVSGDFQRVSAGTGDCGTAPTLAPNSSCTIRVTFAPTAVGTRNGTVTVNDNAANTPQTASLSGNGVPPPGGKYNPVTPVRILDTRYAPFPVGWSSPARLGPGGTLDVQVVDGIRVPTNATAVVINVAVTNTTSNGGYLSVYPTGNPTPVASSLNWSAGQTVPNLVEVQVGSGGQVRAFNGLGEADVIFDLEGWVSPQTVNAVTDGVFHPPKRSSSRSR